MTQKRVKIKPWSLFLNGHDLRNYMTVDMHDEDIWGLADELDIYYEDIKVVLEEAQIFLHAEKFPKYFKVDVYDGGDG